jgi:hypothetical protein
MKGTDHYLERLFKAAALAPRELPSEVPFHLEVGVLAEWRFGCPADQAAFVLPLVRRAFVCACAIVLLSAVLSSLRSDSSPNELIIVDSEIQLSLMQ